VTHKRVPSGHATPDHEDTDREDIDDAGKELTRMAQRWVATDFGGPDVLKLVDYDLPSPGPGEVTISVRAVGLNPADFKGITGAYGADRSVLPLSIGFEVAGVISAIGPNTEIASGGGAVGDEVLAFRISGGYATAVTVPARDVFAKPPNLGFPEAANLLLAGATAADMLRATDVGAGDTVLVHGASGAVGVSVLQQARLLGARTIGTASERNFELVRRFGGEPVSYGPGLEQRLREAVPDGVDAALDTVGTDEAVDVSLALVADRARIVTIAAGARAEKDGFTIVGGREPESAAFRNSVRPRLIELAAGGELEVPIARTFAFADAPDALRLLQTGHPGGKLALVI
jgi:NADPH:quinone reductase